MKAKTLTNGRHKPLDAEGLDAASTNPGCTYHAVLAFGDNVRVKVYPYKPSWGELWDEAGLLKQQLLCYGRCHSECTWRLYSVDGSGNGVLFSQGSGVVD